MLTVERVDNWEVVGASAWNELVRASATRSVFQTYEWHRAWWQVFGENTKELLLLVAFEEGQPLGVAAFHIDKDQVLRFAGHGRSDYCDIICEAERSDVRSALWRRVLQERSDWKRIDLHNLPLDSPSVAHLASLGLRTLRTDTVPCPTLLIDGYREQFADVLKKKSLRRHHNHFRRQPEYQVEHLTRADRILPYLDEFFEQHIGRWAPTPHASLFTDERNRRFFRAVTEHLDGTGWLRFTRVAVQGQAIAFHFGFVFERTFFWYKPSFDVNLAKRSPGEALLRELFDLAAEEGLYEFDFTVGGEAFKKRFANHTRYNIDAAIYASVVEFQLQRTILSTKKRLRGSAFARPIYDWAKRLVGS